MLDNRRILLTTQAEPATVGPAGAARSLGWRRSYGEVSNGGRKSCVALLWPRWSLLVCCPSPRPQWQPQVTVATPARRMVSTREQLAHTEPVSYTHLTLPTKRIV